MDILIHFVLRSFHVKLFLYNFHSNFYFKLCLPLCVVILYGSLFFKVLFSPKLLLCDIFETLTLKFFPLNWREVFILSIPLSFFYYVMLYRLIFPLLEFISRSVFPHSSLSQFSFVSRMISFSLLLHVSFNTYIFMFIHLYLCFSMNVYYFLSVSLLVCINFPLFLFKRVSLSLCFFILVFPQSKNDRQATQCPYVDGSHIGNWTKIGGGEENICLRSKNLKFDVFSIFLGEKNVISYSTML